MDERRCPCGTRLSRYNDGELCFACDDRAAREAFEAEARQVVTSRPVQRGRFIADDEWEALLTEKLSGLSDAA